MSDNRMQSPLIAQTDAVHGGRGQTGARVTLFERPFLGQIALRGEPDDEAFFKACRDTLGIAPATTPNTVVEGTDVVIAWQRPTEWLLLCEPEARQDWLDRLRVALGDVHAGVVDLSGGQTLIAIEGEHALDVLAKGTTLDLHPRVFGTGDCARTLLAKTTAFIRVIEPGRSFEIVVRRSFADYLWQWLRDASGEYGCEVRAPQSCLVVTQTPVNDAPAVAATQEERG